MNKLFILTLLISSFSASADSIPTADVRINIFVSSKTKKLDPPTWSAQLQAKWQQLFRKKQFHCIIAGSAEEMAEKITALLEKKNAKIGNLWFDSHGYFARRRSLFQIGKDEINAKTVADSSVNQGLRLISRYCDTLTRVGIGSCYGGATFTLAAVEDFPEQRMNGDSLMIRLSHLLNNATVYGSESFVMTGPGMFYDGFTLAGFPKLRKFRDPLFQPVWERVGKWNRYNGSTKEFTSVNTVALTRAGDIYEKSRPFMTNVKKQMKQQKVLAVSRRGNYNIAVLYQSR